MRPAQVRPMPKILAFLQNPWFKPGTPERYIQMYREDQDYHRRVLYLSATGKALCRAFGEDLYMAIHWDNANPRHGAGRSAVLAPDVNHMVAVLMRVKPDVVLLFGKQAQRGWDELVSEDILRNRHVLRAPHPMAYGSARGHLEKIAMETRALCARS